MKQKRGWEGRERKSGKRRKAKTKKNILTHFLP